MYGVRDEASIARELARSLESVRRMAEAQFRSTGRSGPWTVQEVQDLKRFLGASGPQVIARILGRSQAEVQQKIFELGRIQQPGRWTREEIVRFKKIYGSRSDEDLAVIFGRNVEAVRRLATRCCLAKDKAYVKRLAGRGATRMPRWSSEELDVLRKLYPSVSNLEIAKQLNRSVKSVVSKAHHIGLHKDAERLRAMGRENVSLRYDAKT